MAERVRAGARLTCFICRRLLAGQCVLMRYHGHASRAAINVQCVLLAALRITAVTQS